MNDSPDLGLPDPQLLSGLIAANNGSINRSEIIALLRAARLLVPTVPSLDGSEMHNPILQTIDGRQALLAFTGLQGLQAWRADARPLAMSATEAARACLSAKLDALLIDAQLPSQFAVSGIELFAIAA